MVRAVRVRRRRGIHVLMGTLALVAGCTSGRASMAQHTEVSGVVRDRATGRVIAGARVVGADGSLAETDAEGRFRLYVRGAQADVRISAAGHSPEHVEIEGLETSIALVPIDDLFATSDETHVVSFVEEASYVEETWSLDAGVLGDATTIASPCAEASLAQAHSEIACSSCHASANASASCATCHAVEATTIRGSFTAAGDVAPHDVAPHDGLGGGCLACHGEIAHGDAASACVRCHGSEASTRRAEVGRFFALATSSAIDLEAHGTAFRFGATRDVGVSEATIATWARALARDRSGGAHDPRATRTVGMALDRALAH